MHHRYPTKPMLVLACALALAACGNSDTGTTPGVAQALVNAVDTAASAVTTDSHGNASVQVDGQEFRFKVVQCKWDFPHPILKEQRVELSLTGAHPYTPRDLVRLLTDQPDAGIDRERAKHAATVYAYGPTLTITRMDDGAEVVGLMTSEMQGWVASDGNGELTITGVNRGGARVSGRMNAKDMSSGSEVQLAVEATCP